MPNAITEETRRLMEVLSDGQWHTYEDVVAKVAVTVAPGRALRFYESRNTYSPPNGQERIRPEPDEASKIASGQRAIVVKAINSIKRKHFEMEERDGVKRLRRIEPVTPPPRLPPLVVDAAPPPVAPSTSPPAPAPMVIEDVLPDLAEISPNPVSVELQVRALRRQLTSLSSQIAEFRDDVRDSLDRYQRGLELFLAARLADVEHALHQYRCQCTRQQQPHPRTHVVDRDQAQREQLAREDDNGNRVRRRRRGGGGGGNPGSNNVGGNNAGGSGNAPRV